MKIIVPCSSCFKLNNVDLDKASHIRAICANCKSYLPIHDGIQDVNGQTLKKLITNAKMPVVVDFWASWCGPCKSFAPTYKTVAQDMREHIIFAKFNTEEDQNASVNYNIRSIPTLIVFNNGLEVDRQSGAMQKTTLQTYLSRFVNSNNNHF